jgi:GT2 family glycosyltransferase
LDANVLPDESMFWGAADLDFWLRVRAAGFLILVDAEAQRASRDKGRSGESWCGYYIARNGFHLRRRYGGPSWTVWHLLKSARRFQLAPSRAHRIAILRGLIDGVRGRTGRNPEFTR